jgi:iron complex outermembrane recepter protein
MFIADWTHISESWTDAERTYAIRRPDSDLVGANVTFRDATDQWSLSIGGTNLLDDRYVVAGGANLAGGLITGTYNRPREWYARLGMKF